MTKTNKSVFSFLRMLTTWHCPHSLATRHAAECHAAIHRHLLSASSQQQTCSRGYASAAHAGTDKHILPLEWKTGNYVFYPMAPFLMKLDDLHTTTRNFYHICCVIAQCQSVHWLGAEGLQDAKSCRGTCVVTSSSMWPIATDAQLWHGRSIHTDAWREA